jgi:hypothetical protein
MILFHGSNVEVCTPDTIHSRSNLDFGRGFYTTSIRSQAEKWCERFKKKYGVSFISKYELDGAVFSDCSVLKFDTYSAEWLDFIVECRRGNDTDKYNLIIGGVADDKVFNTCELYFRGYIPKETALERLRFEQPNIQYCFKDQNTIDKYLKYIGSEKI